jgi:DNA-directed RNA polymerase sigma subunit (sigma70/sigma32)
VKFLSGKICLTTVQLLSAERFVTTALFCAGIDAERYESNHKDPTFDSSDVSDPEDDVEGFHFQEALSAALAPLDRANPRAREWVLAMQAGQTKVELAEKWGVTPQAVQKFEERNLWKIQAIMSSYLGI